MNEASFTYEDYRAIARWILERTPHRPRVGIIAGSGLGGLGDGLESAQVFPYGDIPQFPQSTVAGHAGRLVLGRLSNVPVVVMQGRFHFYEGHSMHRVTLPVRVMATMGIETLIVTNAAGGINPAFNVGDIMCISDHIFIPGMAGHHPLIGPNDDRLGPRFPDLSNAYSPTLRRLAHEVAAEQGIDLRDGVYVMVSGPSYETPAELRFLRAIGADAVGMSTVPEVVVARHQGVKVLGFSLITNKVITEPRESDEPMELHEEVVAIGNQRAAVLRELVRGIVARLGA